MWLRRDLLDQVSRWRDGAALAEIFAPPPTDRGWIADQAARAEQILDAQSRVINRFGGLDLEPLRTVSFVHRGQVYLAPHFDWGGFPSVLSPKALAVFLAVTQPVVDPEVAIAAITAAGDALVLGPGQANTCFRYTGFTYANVHDSFEATAAERIDIDNPSLLFFDAGGTVIGCGWFRPIAGARSVFGAPLDTLVEEWFVHVAGRHTDNGGFEPDEDGGARHHDEFWDLHLWFSRDDLGNPAGLPTVGMSMESAHLPAPPNVGHAASPGAVHEVVCPDGRSVAGLYEPAP